MNVLTINNENIIISVKSVMAGYVIQFNEFETDNMMSDKLGYTYNPDEDSYLEPIP